MSNHYITQIGKFLHESGTQGTRTRQFVALGLALGASGLACIFMGRYIQESQKQVSAVRVNRKENKDRVL